MIPKISNTSPANQEHIKKELDAILSAVSQTALVSITDSKGTITYVNDTFVEVSKYNSDELLGENHRILKSGHQPDELFSELWATISKGNVWRGEIKNKAKDGSYYWVDTSIAPIIGDEGKPERYVAVRFLVTDKKETQQKLSSQNTELDKTRKAMLNLLEDLEVEKKGAEKAARDLVKFKLAVESTSEQIVITDPEGTILYANPALKEITGFDPEEAVGKKAGNKDLWGGQMDKGFYKQLWQTIKEKKQIYTGEIINKNKRGKQYIAHSTISPVLAEDGSVEFYVGIERDVTKEKEVDKAKTEFVSLASHQLRTPLSTINWYAELLLSEDAGKLNKEQKKYIEEAYKGSKRMVNLVNALLNVSRIELGTFAVDPEELNLPELLASTINEMTPDINDKEIRFNNTTKGAIPVIYADPNLIGIVFQNLINNAVKYTLPGKKVEVGLRMCDKGEKIDRKKCPDDGLVFIVQDQGMGIPKSQQKNIFTKLFRADNAMESDAEGTGLGLYIVKSIVEHAGGRVWFNSTEKKGTTFYVFLPLKGMNKKEGTKTLA